MSGELREEQVNLRVTEEQVSRWRQAAESDRRSLSDWMRLALDDAAINRTKNDRGKAK